MLRPLRDGVLVRFDPIVEVTRASGLILQSDAVNDKYREALVLAIGKDVRDVAVGDRLLLSGYAGTSVGGDSDERIICESEAWGILASV